LSRALVVPIRFRALLIALAFPALAVLPVHADPIDDATILAQETAAAPRNLTGEWSESGTILRWDAPASLAGQPQVLGYKVYKIAPGPSTEIHDLPADVTSFGDTSGTPDTAFIFYVKAVYPHTDSMASNIVEELGTWPHCTWVGYTLNPPDVYTHPECLFPLPP
jgi:hypothetical protein